MIDKKKESGSLSDGEIKRYSRNMLIEGWNGKEGQQKLKDATVLVVGAGGSGSPLLYYLAAAGVGKIRVCDGDTVDLSNLNRQILHADSRIGLNKAESAKKTLESFNSDIEIFSLAENLSFENVDEVVGDADVICCAADDRNGREAYKILDRYASEKYVPISWAGGINLGGFLTFVLPPETPCMECFLAHSDKTIEAIRSGEAKQTDDSFISPGGPNPIVGAAAGIAGSMQALETVKLIVGMGTTLFGRVLIFQMDKEIAFTQYDIDEVRREGCPYCARQ